MYVVDGRAKPVICQTAQSLFHHGETTYIQGWMTVQRSYSRALEQGPLRAGRLRGVLLAILGRLGLEVGAAADQVFWQAPPRASSVADSIVKKRTLFAF